jgi:hypothetical protein
MTVSRKRPFVILVLIPLLLSFGSLYVVIYLAAIPDMERELLMVILTGLYGWVSIGYGFYATRQKGDNYFRQNSPTESLREHEFIKKIVYIEGPIVIPISLILVLLTFYYPILILTEWLMDLLISVSSFLNSLTGGCRLVDNTIS